MIEKVVQDDLLVLGEAVGIYTMNPLWVPIPIQRKLGMTRLIQEEGVFMLGVFDPTELVFKMLKIRGKKVKNLSLRLTTKGNLFFLFNIFNLEQRKQNSYARNST